MSDQNADNAPKAPAAPDYRAMYEAEQQKYANLQSAFNRRDAEIRDLRLAAQPRQTFQDPPIDSAPDEPRYDPRAQQKAQEREMQRDFEVAETRYIVKNPDAQKEWNKVEEVVQRMRTDPFTAQRYLAYDGDGNLNWNKMFSDIHRDIQLEGLRTNGGAARPAPNTPSLPPGAATISGSQTNSQPDAPKSLDSMTEEELLAEMEREGMVSQDDPIKGRSGSLR
jgi:hypothetical protein